MGLVTSETDPDTVLDEQAPLVKEFIEGDIVTQIKEDTELFHYFFKETESLEGWRLHYDQPDKKLYYKFEQGSSKMSAMYECIVDAPVNHVIAIFGESDIFT